MNEATNPYVAPVASQASPLESPRRRSKLGIALAVPLGLLGIGGIGGFLLVVGMLISMELEGYGLSAFADWGDCFFLLASTILGIIGLGSFRVALACLNARWRRAVRAFIILLVLTLCWCYCTVLSTSYST